jgi:cobalt-zinc-cadmium efflux system protein
MAHSHRHHRYHEPAAGVDRTLDAAFALGAALNLAFVGAEATYALVGHSVALLADAGHNLGDVLGLLVAWGGLALGRRRPTARFTYGYLGTSILAALFNAIVLLVTVGGIAVEALRRFAEPQPVDGTLVMIVAAVGIAVNGAAALLFRGRSQRDLNVRAAWLHMLGDAVVSLGVVLSGAAVMLTEAAWIDPAMSLVIAVFLIVSTWRLLRHSLAMALQAVPADIDPSAVRSYLAELPGVTAVHDLHIWPMSTTERALTCHLVIPGGHPGDGALAEFAGRLEERFEIGHVTIQVETGDPAHACKLVPDHVV